MGAHFGDLAFMEHAYLVGVDDCRQPVGDDDRGAFFHKFLKRILHETLAFGVESRSRFVENKNGRILQDGSRYADALALTAERRQPRSPITVS